jgi:adenine-specific DNA-methyltransferase
VGGKGGAGFGFKYFKLSRSNFKIWCGNEITVENIERQMEMFIDPVKPGSLVENMLFELMLKSGYKLTDKVENKNGNYYIINNELVIVLTKMTSEIAEEIINIHPQKVIALDRLFAGNDELKTNTALQMRDAGVEFRTV